MDEWIKVVHRGDDK
ncbi:hypothetical protein [Pyrobaculum aerophilum]